VSITSVLTQSPALPTRSALETAARDLGVELAWKESAAGLSLGLCGATLQIRGVAGPVPNAEADTAAFLSLSSVSGKWRLGSHAAHLAMSLEGPMQVQAEGLRNRLAGAVREASALERLSIYTRAVAAVTRAVNGLGVHWAAAPVTHAPDFFTQLVKETPLPLPLWLGVSLTPEPGARTTVLSFGMKQLALPDLLLAGPGGAALPDTIDFFFSALASIAERGRAPEEGETIPRSLLSRPKVRYVESPVESGTKVWKLEI
jgi:hypothetical protein